VLCSDRTKKSGKRTSAEQAEASHSSLNSTLTEVADKQCTNTERLTPRALRYARRSGLVEPADQPDRKSISSTAKSPASTQNTQASASTSRTTDSRARSGRKRRSTETAVPETHGKKAKKESSNTSLSRKPKQQSVPKKQAAHRRSPKPAVVRKPADRQTSQKIGNLERRKDKAAKGDKASAKATAGQPSVGAAAAGHISTKKRLQRSTATAAASAETLPAVVPEETATASTSQSSRTVTRRAATKRGGTLLTSSSHLTDTTGSCASSK